LNVTNQQDGSVAGTLTLDGPQHLAEHAFTGTVDGSATIHFDIATDYTVCGTIPAKGLVSWTSQIATDGTMTGSFMYSTPVGPAFCLGTSTGATFPFATENQVDHLARVR
jgi:hypothetical protein